MLVWLQFRLPRFPLPRMARRDAAPPADLSARVAGERDPLARVLRQERPETKIVVSEPTDAQLLGSGKPQERNADGTRPTELFLKVGDTVEVSSPAIGSISNKLV